MQLGLIGLGKMGSGMRARLEHAGHSVVGYDADPTISDVSSLPDLVSALSAPRVVWVMVPAGEPTRQTIEALNSHLSSGDLVIDGGNSRFTEDAVHARILSESGIDFVDAGVSGGLWGQTQGYALMVGGEPSVVERAQPIFDALRPSGDAGFVHAGPVGAGHFTKMVHNGIEYGLMQAYAEGYELLLASDLVADVPAVVRSWTQGTVIRSWLLDLLARALDEDPDFEKLAGYVDDSGEGRWTVEEAINHSVPIPVITSALFARFSSRQDDSPAMKAVAALRHQFGGHAVHKES